MIRCRLFFILLGCLDDGLRRSIEVSRQRVKKKCSVGVVQGLIIGYYLACQRQP